MTNTEQPDKGDVLAGEANKHMKVGFAELIGLKYTDVSADRVAAELTVNPTLHQPYGIVHGGVYCAIIETMASVGGACWYGSKGHVVGVNNNTDFLRSIREGTVYAEATPIHRGRGQQLWLVTVADAEGRLLARGQVRLANLEDRAEGGAASAGR
jgi:uncharacterized protein (TIGR00369 family)